MNLFCYITTLLKIFATSACALCCFLGEYYAMCFGFLILLFSDVLIIVSVETQDYYECKNEDDVLPLPNEEDES